MMTDEIRSWSALTLGLGSVFSLLGCQPMATPQADIQSRDPYSRVSGIKQVVSEGRNTAIPSLVGRLEDEDVVVRFSAIVALEKMTGTRLGYRYWDSQRDRTESVNRWRKRILDDVNRRQEIPPQSAISHKSVRKDEIIER